VSRSLNIALILTAYDKATRVINDAVGKSNAKLRELKKNSQDAFGKGIAFGGAGLAIAVPLAEATKAAIGFEDKMADVAKVMNLTVGSGDFNKMGDQAKTLAQYLGKTGEEAAGLMASLAAGGVGAEEMAEVGKIAGEMGVAFGMASDQAGQSFIKIKNALGTTVPEAKKVADAINYLSDSMASEASEIVTFMASGGSSVAASFRLAGKDAAAFGSTLISLGKSSSESATIFERMAKGIFKNDDLKGIFDKAGGGAQGFMAVLEAGTKSKDPFAFFQKFGEYGSDIQLLASRTDLLKGALGGVADEMSYANSVSKEFDNRNSTTQGKLNKLKAGFDVLKIQLGEAFLPALQKVGSWLLKVASAIGVWAKENPRLAKSLMFAAAAVSGFLLLAGALYIVKGAFMAMKVAMMTNPIGLILLAIALVAGVIIANWDKIGPFFKALWASVKKMFSDAWTWLKNLILNYTPYGLIFKHWDKIVPYFVALWEGVKRPFMQVWEWIKGLASLFFDAGKNIVISIGEGIEAAAQKLLDKVKKLAKDIRDFFPFSPAKTGPLKDIHKIKLVETIAAGVKPAPMLSAINRVAGATANAFGGGGAAPSFGGGGGGASITYAPNITFSGGITSSSKLEFSQMLRQHADEIMRLIKSETDKKSRLSY
jgi:TP901 family phage tail tape measure protein